MEPQVSMAIHLSNTVLNCIKWPPNPTMTCSCSLTLIIYSQRLETKQGHFTMARLMSLALISSSTINAVLAGSLAVKNNCGFNIYCAGAKNAESTHPNGQATATVLVSSGATWTSNLVAANDNVGAVLKACLHMIFSTADHFILTIRT